MLPSRSGFDYSKWDRLEISDDEDTFHPNLDKGLNIRVNRITRERKEDEIDDEVKKLTAEGELEKAAKLEARRPLHVGNVCHIAEERTIIQSSDGSRKDRLKKGEEFSADEQQGIAKSFRSRTALAAHIQSIGCATMTGRGPPTGRWRWHLALRYFFGFYIYISNFPHKWQAIRRLS
ncbi:unnamed protein product [Durusdinium trenchii]|uniref:Cdc37 N-terminal domain-containing protein n=1 Tax=Durusdinium trenchii TaxID=1381693 RepID=A0ABP0I894_9DINO